MTAKPTVQQLVQSALDGEQGALAALFEAHRERLGRMVRLRMDPRLAARIDESDVLQEAYIDVQNRFNEFARDHSVSVLVWLRSITGQKLVDLHRHHLGAQKRDAGREVSLYRRGMPPASSVSLAEQLLGRITSASREAIRAETKLYVQKVLNEMDEIDREVLCLRHFEHLTNAEAAEALGLKPSAASNRYVRALARLKEVLLAAPGLSEDHLE